MDLALLRLLQTMAKLEEDPDFRSKKYVIVDGAGSGNGGNNLRGVLDHIGLPDTFSMFSDLSINEDGTPSFQAPAVTSKGLKHRSVDHSPFRAEEVSDNVPVTSTATAPAPVFRQHRDEHVTDKDLNGNSKTSSNIGAKASLEDPNVVPVVLNYPDSVIVVASTPGAAPPKADGECRVARLSDALLMAVGHSKAGLSGCSIVVHPGLYLNPGFQKYAPMIREGYSLEIVGIKDVRIVNTRDDFTFIFHSKARLTLKNLFIYDFTEKASTIVVVASKLDLADVRVYGSKHSAIHATQNCVLKVDRSTFKGCRQGFFVGDCVSKFTDCRWKKVTQCFVFGGALSLTSSSMVSVKIAAVFVAGSARASIERCEFVARNDSGGPEGITANAGAQFTVKKCLFVGFGATFGVSESHSKAEIKECELRGCYYAVRSDMNSSFSVVDCDLAVDVVLRLLLSTRGEIEFRGNSLRASANPHYERAAAEGVAVFLTDCDIGFIKHDFEAFECQCETSDGVTPRNIRQLVRKKHVMQGKGPRKESEHYNANNVLRVCAYCCKNSTPSLDAKAKVRYCSICRAVAYCSKDCQEAHWRDHKLICKRK